MNIITKIFDFILLDKETRNLIKINKLAEQFEGIQGGATIGNIKEEFKKIKSKEHKDKIDLYLMLIKAYEEHNN